MDKHRLGCCVLLLGGAAVLLYYASQNTPDSMRNPPVQQDESQFNSLAAVDLIGKIPFGPLDMSIENHFWAPGWSNSGSKVDDHPVVRTPHSYPLVPGGNISTVMHHGWARVNEMSGVSDWFYNPPEVAVT